MHINEDGAKITRLHYKYADASEGFTAVGDNAAGWSNISLMLTPSQKSDIITQFSIVLLNTNSSGTTQVESLTLFGLNNYGIKSDDGLLQPYMQGNVTSNEAVEYLSMEKNVNISINPNSYFIIKFKSDINPTYGHHFAIRVTVDGTTKDNKTVEWLDLVPSAPFLPNGSWTIYRTYIGGASNWQLDSIQRIRISISDFTRCNEWHSFYVDYIGFLDEPTFNMWIIGISIMEVVVCTSVIILSIHSLKSRSIPNTL
jgi:hypothetical protein